MLEGLALAGPTWQTPPVTIGDGQTVKLAAEKPAWRAWRQATRQRLPTRAPLRLRRKVKIVKSQELVVGGWLPGAGRLEGRLGSLLVGYLDDGVLRYAGRVGSGLDEHKRPASKPGSPQFARGTSPFDKTPKLPEPHWVEPELVVEVGFQNWTGRGDTACAALPQAARRQGHVGGRPRDPVEHVGPQRMALRDPRVIEVVGRIAAHADLLHHVPRAHVPGRG